MRGASLAGAGFALTQAISIAFYIVMARLAGPEVFGAFAAATALPGFASLFAESGMQGALIQRRDRIEEAAATAVIATFAAGFGLSLVALALAPLVGLYFDDSEIGLATAALSGILFLNAITAVPDALMQRRFSFLRRVIVDPLNMLTYGIVSTALLAAGLGLWGLVIGLYAGTIVRVLAAWLLARWRPQLRLASFAMWRELVSFGRHVVAAEFLREIGAMANIAVVGRVFGVAPLGQFRFGHRLAAQASTPIVVASAYALFPAFSRIAEDEDRLREATLRSLRFLAVATFPISLALVPLGEQLVLLLLGDQWEQAGRILAALCGLTAALPLITTASELCKATGKPRFLTRISGLAGIASIVSLFAFAPWGIVWVAVGLSLASLVVAAYTLRTAAGILRVPLRQVFRQLFPPVPAALGAAGLVLLLQELGVFGSPTATWQLLGLIAIEGSLFFCTYVLLLTAISPATLVETIRIVPTARLRSLVRRRAGRRS